LDTGIERSGMRQIPRAGGAELDSAPPGPIFDVLSAPVGDGISPMKKEHLMRLTTFCAAVAICAAPSVAHAKGPTFGDLISELTLPARVEPGASFDAQARTDIAAFCRRTKVFSGPSCDQLSSIENAQPVLTLRSTAPDGGQGIRISNLSAMLTRDAAGVYRGTFHTLPCQKAGIYTAETIEPNPIVAAAVLEVTSTRACAADLAPPRIARVLLPARTRSPDHLPKDFSDWGKGRLVVEVDDDASGAMQLGYELTGATDDTASYGSSTIDCAPCGARWTCSADVPLCAPGLGDTALRVSWVRDRAGRQVSWYPLAGAPFAVAHCGADDAPAPTPSCPAGPVPPPPAPSDRDAGPSVPADADPAPALPVDASPDPASVPTTKEQPKESSGCSFGGLAPAPLPVLVALGVIALRRATGKRRGWRGGTRPPQ
jgi:hypothetical protein